MGVGGLGVGAVVVETNSITGVVGLGDWGWGGGGW